MGKTILISSHILHELAQLCTRIGIIEQGQMVAEGSLEDIYRKLMKEIEGKNAVVVWNKADLPPVDNVADIVFESVAVSALDRRGIKELEALLAHKITGGNMPGHDVVLTNVRHIEALSRAAEVLRQAWQVLSVNGPAEVASDGIKTAVNSLDAITGRNVDADMIEQIFARFCIGK